MLIANFWWQMHGQPPGGAKNVNEEILHHGREKQKHVTTHHSRRSSAFLSTQSGPTFKGISYGRPYTISIKHRFKVHDHHEHHEPKDAPSAATASVIWLHGLGDTGAGWVEPWRFRRCRVEPSRWAEKTSTRAENALMGYYVFKKRQKNGAKLVRNILLLNLTTLESRVIGQPAGPIVPGATRSQAP